jgi:2-dehydro-3-deoxygluconokinase
MPPDQVAESLDLVTVGEALLRLSAPLGSLIVDAQNLSVHVAGTELNVAAAVARMGYRSAWLSVLPDNALGRRVTEHATLCGVDESQVKFVKDGRLGTYFFEPGVEPRPARVIYDRTNSTAAAMAFEDFDWKKLTTARLLHLTGITAAISPQGADLVERALTWARQHQMTSVFDLNYRALLWSCQECRQVLEPLLGMVDILLTSARDAAAIFELEGPPEKVLQALHERFSCKAVALTTGSAGAVGWVAQHSFVVPGYTVQIINRIGAGDSFAAGVICGLLENDFRLGVRYGVAMSALTLTVSGDTFAFARPDVLSLLERGSFVSIVR